ncbi:ATP-binding cassette domain-containing protein [Lacihabitans sp. CCS-44]|uniref:peptidase domain-containing ABC transporter n=1 Tax=Lacihabitans sp. CCS-44 TaxID=2487331 RepID=UPI0020CC7750|nr:ATP-binding cassette domain-containing protein [Lacihabitans sp. CCS-44]MCP9755292.1 ATP-binding cassette domain-containing protein [Lacihabitans sp. CCS-44]
MEQKYSSTIRSATSRILDLLKLDKEDISSIYIFSIFAGILSLSLPLGIQAIIGFVMAGSLSTSIIVLIGLVLAGTFFTGLLQVRTLEMIEKIEQKLFVRYALEYGNRLPKLNIEKLDSYYLPELVNRFFDISTLQKSLQKLLVEVPAAIIQVILGILLLAFYHPLFIAFGFLLFITVSLILHYTSHKGFATSIETSDNKYKIAGWLEEMARSIKSFKYSKKSHLHLENTDKLVSKYLDSRTRHFKILQVQYWSLIGFKLLITASMLIIGVWLLINQQINIGQFIAADIVIIAIMGSIEKLIGVLDQVYEALTAVEKLNKVAEAEIETSGKEKLSVITEGVSIGFEKVDFSYEINNEILKDLTFDVKAGQWVLINGKSGAGKSSVLRLLTGAFKNFTGNIILDGLPIRNYDCESIRSKTGILLGQQDIFLGTLEQNLTLGIPTISVQDILQISKLTGLDSFITSSDKGLETTIDPIGKRLPSEIRHAILLTRSLLGNSRLFLFEEPFKYLNETQMLNVIDYLKSTSATVILASESMICEKYCDVILKLENGKINSIK